MVIITITITITITVNSMMVIIIVAIIKHNNVTTTTNNNNNNNNNNNAVHDLAEDVPEVGPRHFRAKRLRVVQVVLQHLWGKLSMPVSATHIWTYRRL